MFCLAAFFAFSALLVVPIESMTDPVEPGTPLDPIYPTYFSVPYRLNCQGPFSYTITLFEADYGSIFNPDDIIGKNAGQARDVVTGTLTGSEHGDGTRGTILGDDGWYEPFVRVEHNCNGQERTEDRFLEKCKVNTTQCNYPTQVWNL